VERENKTNRYKVGLPVVMLCSGNGVQIFKLHQEAVVIVWTIADSDEPQMTSY